MRLLPVLVLAACGARATTERSAFISSDAPPGTRWITPALPWHLADGAGGVVVAGDVALVAGVTRGEIEEIDLTTGARGRVHSLGKQLSVESFVRISDGRYLIAGTQDQQVHAALVDPVTFAPTWFPLERVAFDKDAYASARAVELADHAIAITGVDLPLAVYDPTTLARTRVLDPRPTWTELAATTSTLFAQRGAHEEVRVDLATAAITKPTGTVLDAAGDTLVVRTFEKGDIKFRAITGTVTRDLPSTLGFWASLDATGERVASLRTGVITVYSTVGGSVLGRFDPSPQYLFTAKLVFAGDRLIIAFANTLRVADLRTGALTEVPEPFGPYQQLAVDAAGTVVAIGAEVWRYRDGALASTASLGKSTVLVRGEPQTRFATRTVRRLEPGGRRAKFPSVIVVKTLEGRAIREVPLPRETEAAWLGAQGKLIVSYSWDTDVAQKLVRVQGTKLYDIVAFNSDASIDDVDVDGSIAAFSLDGTVTLLDTTTGAKLREIYNPGCVEYGSAELERDGERVIVSDDQTAILYDRSTGRVLGVARFPTPMHSTTFIPGADELLVRLADRVLLWDPATNRTRQVVYRDVFAISVSPDRRHAAMALRDGRLALVDFAAFRAAMTPGPTLPKASVPTTCSTRDPFDLRDPTAEPDIHEDADSSDGVDEESGE